MWHNENLTQPHIMEFFLSSLLSFSECMCVFQCLYALLHIITHFMVFHYSAEQFHFSFICIYSAEQNKNPFSIWTCSAVCKRTLPAQLRPQCRCPLCSTHLHKSANRPINANKFPVISLLHIKDITGKSVLLSCGMQLCLNNE